MLELLSVEGRSLAELMAEFRSRYFISGEINSEVADHEAKMAEIAERYGDGEQTTARRHLGRLPRVALQRPPVQHRAAAAPQPRVAGLARGHGGQARRGSGDDSRRDAHPRAGARAGGAGRHSLPADPDALRGRTGQLLPDRGRAADPGRHRPQLGQGAGRASVPARGARALDRGPRAADHHPPAHRPPRAGRRSSPTARAPRSPRWGSRPTASPTSARTPSAKTLSRSS